MEALQEVETTHAVHVIPIDKQDGGLVTLTSTDESMSVDLAEVGRNWSTESDTDCFMPVQEKHVHGKNRQPAIWSSPVQPLINGDFVPLSRNSKGVLEIRFTLLDSHDNEEQWVPKEFDYF